MTNILEEISKSCGCDTTYKPADFKVENDVRWCSGCGSYGILSQVQKILPELGVPKEKFVFISGIGCSGRFSYYVDTYGFHSIHGRPIAIASGLKLARPDLSVWVATGDGDCMSIGGNHMIHACRRNINLNVLMFNNEVYSLTKGQYSPTSQQGQVTKSSPLGVLEEPFVPAGLALGSGATMVGRGFDRDAAGMKNMFKAAHDHQGLSFIELYTNCVIFNDSAFDPFTSRQSRKEHTVNVEHGKPLVFGENDDKGIIMDGFKPKVVSLADGYSVSDFLVHDQHDVALAYIIAQMSYHNPELPRAMGILQSIVKPSYDQLTEAQIAHEQEAKGKPDVQKLLRGKDSWVVE
ncbi:2-oxoacid:ferredoxin oxidoreductase subunit beta [Flammeovirgaceae bacterium SG7u.111]|nr:2-oxoacid:ferredoxin oxidoreductase subunit beta [Flammeovirgaceae bacterium SG7u.132]WPO34367.1 2-oxoacid:ferredoxin oxidoreductase subunit beta [Flammeovirgaceae bacterium SG7u.111]